MVSIGPFHKQKAEFHAMEELKWLYMLAFVDRAKMQTKEFSALYVCGKNILEVEEKARAWCKKINTQKFEDEFLQGPPESRVPFESPAEYTVSEQAQGNQQAQGKQQAHDKVNKDALIAGDFFCVSSRFLQGVSIANHVFDKISTPERSYAAATSGSLTASVIDANHPYYLHPSDNTGMLLTTVVLNSRTTHSGINP
ncbi:hypothetical protein AgCh_035601 [Apium graveolens]